MLSYQRTVCHCRNYEKKSIGWYFDIRQKKSQKYIEIAQGYFGPKTLYWVMKTL